MEISNLTFIVTDNCNFNCTYCPQTKEKQTLPLNLIETAVDFFYPFLLIPQKNVQKQEFETLPSENEGPGAVQGGVGRRPILRSAREIHTGFYGGEPLLAYEQIQHAVLLLHEKNQSGHKNISFSVTTNGSLLTDPMLEFFNRFKFNLTLSFDGLAQETGREKNSLAKTLRIMKRIREYPDINFEINSVFSPLTIPLLSESLRFMIEQGGPEITFNLSSLEHWNPAAIDTFKKELRRLADFLAKYYNEKGKIPVKNFQVPVRGGGGPGIFRCSAGNEQISLAPDGKVWGCFLFHDYFKTREDSPRYWDYCFGDLGDFIVNYKTRYPEKVVNYSDLRQDMFQVEGGGGDFCFLCGEISGCMVCPVYAAYTTGTLGKISCRHCELMKIQNKVTREPF